MESRRLLLAAGLSLGVLLLWEFLAPKPSRRPVPPPPAPAASVTAGRPDAAAAPTDGPAPQTAVSAAAAATPPAAAEAEASATIENPVLKATFSNRGAVLTSLTLKQYTDEQGRPLELVRNLPAGLPRPFALEFPGHPDAAKKAASALFVLERDGDRKVRLRWSDGALSVSKEISLDARYLFDVRVAVSGPSFYLLAGP